MLLACLLALSVVTGRDLKAEPYLRVEQTLAPLSIVAGLDLWSTGYKVRIGDAKELHPWMQGPDERAASQFIFVGTSMLIVHGVDRRWGRTKAIRALLLILGIKVTVVGWNLTRGH